MENPPFSIGNTSSFRVHFPLHVSLPEGIPGSSKCEKKSAFSPEKYIQKGRHFTYSGRSRYTQTGNLRKRFHLYKNTVEFCDFKPPQRESLEQGFKGSAASATYPLCHHSPPQEIASLIKGL